MNESTPNAGSRQGEPESGLPRSAFEGIRAVFFDLFDTLVEVQPNRLPIAHFHGMEIATTAPAVFEAMRELDRSLEFETFFVEYSHVSEAFWDEKKERGVELPGALRMERVLEQLGIGRAAHRKRDGFRLAECHMHSFQRAVVPIEGAREVLERVAAAGLPCVLISNLDFAPAAHSIVDRFGFAPYFAHRVISEEVGLRKPHPKLFESALEAVGVEAAAALHVGDDAEADAWGATQAGLRSVWIDRKNVGYSLPDHAPAYRIGALTELLDALPE